MTLAGWPAAALAVLLAALPAVRVAAAAEEAADPVAAGQIARAILSAPGDAAYGRSLAGECMTCHQQGGAAQGMPPITGLPTDYLVQALVEYRMGLRQDDVMRLMAARLTNEQIAALAAYFASLRTDATE